MSTPPPPPAPAAEDGKSVATAEDAADAGAEPLSPRAREALRGAFLAGASPLSINDVYALGDTIGASLPCFLQAWARAR